MNFSNKFKQIGLLAILLCISYFADAQKTYTISGYIEDDASAEKLIGANIFDPNSSQGATTNTYGFYSLTLPKDSVYLALSYVGYETKYFKLYLDKDVVLNFSLTEGQTLGAVEIVAEKQQRIEESTQMGQMTIPIQQIKSLPALMGEVDVLKSLQLLPGVQSGGEGTSGLYVRGGGPDQNLILLDGVPVYNASHLFGFFSVFNADAIKNVTLTKGGFPARYGGRLSSILDINMKEGNMKEFHGEGSVGTIFSKLTLEGPIIKDKTSFIISGRRTYVDALAGPLIRLGLSQDGVKADPRLFFYDLNAKINHKFSEKDRLFLSYYGGKDDFGIALTESERGSSEESKIDIGLNWGNQTSALRWNRLWSNQLFSNTTLTYSKYELNNLFSFEQIDSEDTAAAGFRYSSGIEDFGLKMDFDYIPNPSHYIRFGAAATRHTFTPGVSQLDFRQDGFSLDTTTGEAIIDAYEFSMYVENDWNITPNFKANIGLHGSAFAVDGTNYFSLQPRLGLRYLLPKNYALKASFATMTQFLHLLSNEGLGLPTDLWLPTTEDVVPEQSWQASIGMAKTFDGGFELSVEGYYKEMKNLLSYKEGASFAGSIFSDSDVGWEEKVTQGDGRSFGFEVFLQKKVGKTTGWIGYTWSKTDRQFDDINGGKRYPFKYDRRHDLSVVVSHQFSERISASAVWVYGSGNSITLPVSKHQPFYSNTIGKDFFGEDAQYFNTWFEAERASDKNAYRMDAYHRLDISVEFKKKKEKFKGKVAWERTWAIGAYNSYNRANPFFIARDLNLFGSNEEDTFRQYSLFPAIPFVSYRFKF